jgi:membrane protease YdiL (CAAX protease family)
LSVLLAIAMAELYSAGDAGSWLASLRQQSDAASSSWLPVVVINSLLALVVLAFYGRQGRLRSLLNWRADTTFFGKKHVLLPYAPALIVLVGVLLLITASRMIGGDLNTDTVHGVVPLAWITWVPLVEELVFRVGLGEAFRRRGGPLWGSWFSAVTFALVHASPTLAHLSSGAIGLPLGPFLLGLCCEALFVTTQRLWPIVALHAACNATVAIFVWGDQRWLAWLQFLYT